MNWLSIILSTLSLLGIIIGFLVMIFKFGRDLGSLKECSIGVLRHLATVSRTEDVIIRALGASIPRGSAEELLKIARDEGRDTIARLTARLSRPGGNPITEEEKKRLLVHLTKLKEVGSLERGSFSVEEAEDFYNLANKVVEEYPRDEALRDVRTIASLLMGMAIRASRPATAEA